jgi:hypothetical protein
MKYISSHVINYQHVSITFVVTYRVVLNQWHAEGGSKPPEIPKFWQSWIEICSLKAPKTKKILLYEMKFFVPNHSCLQNSWLGGCRPQIPVLSVLCPQLNLLTPPPQKNSWVRHCIKRVVRKVCRLKYTMNEAFVITLSGSRYSMWQIIVFFVLL